MEPAAPPSHGLCSPKVAPAPVFTRMPQVSPTRGAVSATVHNWRSVVSSLWLSILHVGSIRVGLIHFLAVRRSITRSTVYDPSDGRHLGRLGVSAVVGGASVHVQSV